MRYLLDGLIGFGVGAFGSYLSAWYFLRRHTAKLRAKTDQILFNSELSCQLRVGRFLMQECIDTHHLQTKKEQELTEWIQCTDKILEQTLR